MDKSKKGHSKLIIACSDPAKNLEFIEEALDQVAFLIGVEIAEPRLYHITFGWDRIRCSLLCDVNANGICSVCFITQNVASGNVHSRKQLTMIFLISDRNKDLSDFIFAYCLSCSANSCPTVL